MVSFLTKKLELGSKGAHKFHNIRVNRHVDV